MSGPSDYDLPPRLGRYVLNTVIGAGGFALVVRAQDEGLASEVALKILKREYALEPEIRERFVREARLLRRVRDLHVIGVHDVGETDDGRPWFVMDLAAGGTLEERLPRRGPVTAEDLRVVAGALESGLGALHEAGVVHRDVKPTNLLVMSPTHPSPGPDSSGLLAPGERLALGDLGLAKDLDASVLGPTMVGGTPRYQAPEQVAVGERVDERTDVYAATAVLWRLLTGVAPPEPDELALQLEGIAGPWQQVLRRGMAGRPQERYDSMAAWGEAVRRALGAGSGQSQVRAPVPGSTCPYKGLAAFQPGDALLYFGRRREVNELVSRLQAHPALVIGGPSGSGKSSLLRAGLLPALEQGALAGSQSWSRCLVAPGPHPMSSLWSGLSALADEPLPELEDHPDPGAVALSRVRRGLVAIDQFEELFTVCADPQERRRFVTTLEALCSRPELPLRVVLCMRADFYGACAGYRWLAEAISRNQVLVGPMGRAGLREAIEGPARRVGLRLEGGLTERILDDAGEEVGALPLLAHALVETWVRRQGPVLTVEGYEAAGGVAGAVSRTAEQVWGGLDEPEQLAARRLFLALVRPGDGTPDTRRKIGWDGVGEDPAIRRVVEVLSVARLVTVDQQGVELIHETLIRTWGRLAAWVEEARDELRTRERLQLAAQEWERQGKDPDLLLRGVPLEAAVEWRERVGGDPGEPLDGYLTAAETARDAELAAETARRERQRRVRRRTMAALGSLTALALMASVVAWLAFGRAREDARRAADQLSRNLALLASQEAADDPFLAVMLAVESMARLDPPLAEARSALIEARAGLGGSHPVPYGDPLPVGNALSVAVNPTGTRAAVGSRDGGVALWDLQERRRILELDGPAGGVHKVAFAPDGSWLVAAGADHGVWRWGTGSSPVAGERLADLGSIVWSVAVSPDGRTVAAATQSAGVLLLDSVTGHLVGDPLATGEFLALAFSPDGRILLAGDGSGQVSGWILPDRTALFPAGLSAHGSDIWELAISSERKEFASVSSDGTVRLWDLETGQARPVGPYDGTTAAPIGLVGATFNPGGQALTLGGPDGRLYEWDLQEQRFTGIRGPHHADAVVDAARSADGTVLVTLSDDQTARVFTQASRPGAYQRVAQVGESLYAVHAAQGRVAVGAGTGVLVLDATTGIELARTSGHPAPVTAVALHPDGGVLTGDSEGNLWWWEQGQSAPAIEVAAAHSGAINVIKVDRDRVATAGADGMVRIWDRADMAPRGDMRGPLPAAVTDLILLAGGEVTAVSRDGRVGRWDRDGRALGPLLQAEPNTIWGAALSPDGSTVALATDDEVVSVWEWGLEPSRILEAGPHAGGTLDVAFVDRFTLVASSRSGQVRFWDVASGRPLGPALVPDGSAVWGLSVIDGVVWAVSEDGGAFFIDVLRPDIACRLAEGAFDDRQSLRVLGAEPALACR